MKIGTMSCDDLMNILRGHIVPALKVTPQRTRPTLTLTLILNLILNSRWMPCQNMRL